jgi:hypothetical protein
MVQYRADNSGVEVGYLALFDADDDPAEQMYMVQIDDLCPGSELLFSL